jgi:two-component system sensor histidine kinase KdpD
MVSHAAESEASSNRRRERPGPSSRRSASNEPAGGLAAAVLAHELRTPLAAFAVTLEVLRESAELNGHDVQRLIEHLQHSSRWMEGVVSNLLTLSLLECDARPFATVPMPALAVVESAMQLVQPIVERHQQRLRLLCPTPAAWIAADPILLGQALVNLLTNASTYGPAGEVIDVSVRTLTGQVELRVTDRGPGIPPAERERIFAPYVRGAAAHRSARGLGLGLHLARMIVERHGGAIGVDSVVGRGASFWIRLPVVPAPVAGEPGRSRDESPAGG